MACGAEHTLPKRLRGDMVWQFMHLKGATWFLIRLLKNVQLRMHASWIDYARREKQVHLSSGELRGICGAVEARFWIKTAGC